MPRRRIAKRLATSTLASAITTTDAIASDADDQVDPHSSANCTIDFASSSMKPAPRKKKCHDQRAAAGSRTAHTAAADTARSEEHTSELQSQSNLVCRLLLEKKKL